MKEEIKISTILKELLKKAKEEGIQANDTTKTEAEGRAHLER